MEFGAFDYLDYGNGDLAGLYESWLTLIEHYGAVEFRVYNLAFVAGGMVYCLPMYHPIRLLEEVCVLDQTSGGRIDSTGLTFEGAKHPFRGMPVVLKPVSARIHR